MGFVAKIWGYIDNKSVPRHCLWQYRLNLEVQGELPWFLICFLNETMQCWFSIFKPSLILIMLTSLPGQVCRSSLPAKSAGQVCQPSLPTPPLLNLIIKNPFYLIHLTSIYSQYSVSAYYNDDIFFWSWRSFPNSFVGGTVVNTPLSHFLLLSAALYISNFFKFIWNEFNYARFSPQNGFNFSIIYNHLIIYPSKLLTLAMFTSLFRHFWNFLRFWWFDRQLFRRKRLLLRIYVSARTESNKWVPRHCLRRSRLNLAVQWELLWFLICF
jgi:hypothetical protein